MEKIEKIIESLNTIKITNEILYNVFDFKEALNKLVACHLEVGECLLTPFYVCDEKVYELYEFELNINFVEVKDFNKHLLNLTRKKTLEKIPQSIVNRQRKCYIELFRDEPVRKDVIEEYLDVLLKSLEVKKQVLEVFAYFDEKNLFFAKY